MSCLCFKRVHPIGQRCAETAPAVKIILLRPLIETQSIICELMLHGWMGRKAGDHDSPYLDDSAHSYCRTLCLSSSFSRSRALRSSAKSVAWNTWQRLSKSKRSHDNTHSVNNRTRHTFSTNEFLCSRASAAFAPASTTLLFADARSFFKLFTSSSARAVFVSASSALVA